MGETWDGCLNDITGQHVTAEYVAAALAGASAWALDPERLLCVLDTYGRRRYTV